MKLVLYIILILSPFHAYGKQDISELQQRYQQQLLKNKLLYSSNLLPELKLFLSQSSHDKDKVIALQIMADIYLQYDAYAESVSSLEKASKLSTPLSSVTRASVLLSQAELSLALAKHDDAIYKTNQSLQVFKEQDQNLYAKALLLQGRVYQKLGSYQQAGNLFSQVKKVVLDETYFSTLASIYNAQIAIEQGAISQAELFLKDISSTNLSSISEEKQLEYQVTLVRISMQKGNFQTTIKVALKLLDHTLGTKFLSLQARLQDILSKSYLQLSNYQKAFMYLQRYTLTQSALALKKRNNKLLQLEIINDLTQKQQRILMLKKEALLTKAKLKQKEDERNKLQREQQRKIKIWLLVIFLAIIFCSIYYSFWQKRIIFKELEIQVEDRTRELKEKNEMLEKLSNTDNLTSLYNRHYLQSIIDTEIANVQRNFFEMKNDNYLVAMIIDIDFFKKVNDSYGHFAGDEVLKEVASLIEESIRESDSLIRWGGEEFLVLLRNFNLRDIPEFTELIRKKIEQKVIVIDDVKLNITCSIGYSHYPFMANDINAYKWKDVLELADIALYTAKENGRNAWVGFTGANVQLLPGELIKNIDKAVKSGEIKLSSNITVFPRSRAITQCA